MIRIFATHPTAANIFMLAILVLGLVALPKLQRDTFPIIPPTEVEVRIPYPGASPADVEDGICLRVESPLRSIEYLVELRCESRDNLAIVTAEMQEGADMGAFYDDIKASIDQITGFPDKAEMATATIVERVAVVGSVAVTGPMNPAALFAYADRLAERLRRDPMIASANVKGFTGREIAIEISARNLRRYGLTGEALAGALSRHSISLPAGTMESLDGDTLIRFEGESRTVEQFARIPLVAAPLGAEVLLGDVATIHERFADDSQLTLFNGERAAIIDIAKTDIQDALDVMAVLQARLSEERLDAPPGVSLSISGDSTTNIRDRLRLIGVNGLQGLALVFIVMWLFFGLRFSFWVSMGLPVSFLGAVFAMQALGLTINMITMVALLVAIGLLMDDAIVISENIIARRRKGESAMTAAIEGARQVMPGVFSSFLTTAMIVGPLAFMVGKMGAILKLIPFILLITLAISLIEAFLILPNHLAHSMKSTDEGRVNKWVGQRFERFRDAIIMPLSRLSLRWRYLTLGLAFFALLASGGLFTGGLLKFQAFPTLDSDIVEARLLLPQGTPQWRTEERVARVTEALTKLNEEFAPLQPGGAPLVQNITVRYGVNVDAPESGGHMATVSADLLRAEARNTTLNTIIDRWRKLTGPLPDMASLRFTDKERGVAGKALEIRLQGEDLAELKAAATEMRGFIRGFAGVRDTADDLRPGKPEIVVRLRPGAASALGVTARAVADQLRRTYRGDTALELQDRAGSIDVIATLPAADRDSLLDLMDLRIEGPEGALVPLSAVASFEETRGYARIMRIDGARTVTVEGTINPAIANAREILNSIKTRLLPRFAEHYPGVSTSIEGESKDTATTGASLQGALVVGLIGVFLILAYQFGSFLQPITVLLAIPMGLIGVLWGHYAFGMQLSMPSMVGLATLAGVVVNDSILLVNFIKDGLRGGMTMLEAAENAVRDRFRAIFLTSLTTIAGLGPLLFETSTQAQFLRPLVASLAFGLTTATFLSLFVTPAIFAILHDFGWIHERAPRADDADDTPQAG